MSESFSFRSVPLFSWLPLLVWMLIIIGLSHMDGESSKALSDWVKTIVYGFLELFGMEDDQEEGGNVGFWLRKIAHIFEYAMLWILSWRFFRYLFPIKKAIGIALLFCLIFASLDEFHQYFIPGRVGQFADVGVDMIGATYCFFVASYLAKKAGV